MKTKWNILTILALLMMLVGGNVTPAQAEELPVLEQLPNPMNFVPADSGFWNSPLCLSGNTPCSGADNVVVQVGTTLTITQIQLWGMYTGDPNAYTDDFTVIIHQDEAGLPGTAIYTENGVNSLRAPTGIIFGEATAEFLVTLTLATPQALEAGAYWIEIYNTGGTLTAEGNPDNIFGWETGDTDTLGLGAPGIAAWQFTTTWLFVPFYDLSLRLFGTVTTPTTYSISGAVFNDADGNGTWDADETGLEDAYLWVDWGCDGQPNFTWPVYPDGSYELHGLPPDTCFALSGGHLSYFTYIGWKQTTPLVKFDPLSADQSGVNIGLQEYQLSHSPDTLPDGQLNQPYSQTITVSGGVTPYSYSMGEANLPGLDVSMDANTGVITISGTPTAADHYYLDLMIEDAKGVGREVQALFFIKTDPSLTLTSSLNPSQQGQEVTFSLGATATTANWPMPPWGQVTFYADGAVIAGCDGLWLQHNGSTGGSAPNPVTCTTSTLAAGSHAITAALTTFYGPYNSATATLQGGQTVNAYVPQYQSTGFGAPLDLGDVLNTAKAGQMIPLKWRLLNGSGNPVTNLDPASVTMTVSPYTCPSGAPTDAIETYATGTSSLQNLSDGYYQLNWKTDKAWTNTCKQIKLQIGTWFGDGFIALFQFKK